KVTRAGEQQLYPDHPERFDKESLTGRCYWEADLTGFADISVAYKGISRKGWSNDC
ncbi:hypothetical protein M9458_034243, partial [Cirrhinus mrigala]